MAAEYYTEVVGLPGAVRGRAEGGDCKHVTAGDG